MRVVLDTDVLLAAFVSPHGASRQWLSGVLRGEVEVMVSVPLVLEYEAALVKKPVARQLTASEAERLIDAFVAQAIRLRFLISGGRPCGIRETRWYWKRR